MGRPGERVAGVTEQEARGRRRLTTTGDGKDPDGGAPHGADAERLDLNADQLDDVHKGQRGIELAVGAAQLEADRLVVLGVERHELDGRSSRCFVVQPSGHDDHPSLEEIVTQGPPELGGPVVAAGAARAVDAHPGSP